MKRLLAIAAVALALASLAEAGEWMFRLRDAHVHMRRALFDRDADAAWEHVNRETRQEAGILAGRIRNGFDGLPPDKKKALAKRLGIADEGKIRALRGRDILVSNFFIDAHAYIFQGGDRDDVKIKAWSTRMTGPTAMIYARKTPEEKVVAYTFTTDDHFGGQAMDYRARLPVPSLDDLLGPAPPPETMDPERIRLQVLEVFEKARRALEAGDVDTLWPLLDCVSHSQASHFADQAREMHAKARAKDPDRIPKRLEITADRLETLDGRGVWTLPWTQRMTAPLVKGTNPRFVPAKKLKQKGRMVTPNPTVEFEHEGRRLSVAFVPNRRDGSLRYTILLRTPYYELIRTPPGVLTNDYSRSFKGVLGAQEKMFTFREGDPAPAITGRYAADPEGGWTADLADDNHGHYHILLFPRGAVPVRTSADAYRLVNGRMEDGKIVFVPASPAFGVERAVWSDGNIRLELAAGGSAVLGKRAFAPSPTLGAAPPGGAESLFDATSIDGFLNVQWDVERKVMYAAAEDSRTRRRYGDFHLHLEFRNGLDRETPARSPTEVRYGPLTVRLGDTFGFDSDEFGAVGPVPPAYSKQHGKHFTRLAAKWKPGAGVPALVCGEVFDGNRRISAKQLPNFCAPPLAWQTLDWQVAAGDGKAPEVTVRINGQTVLDGVAVPLKSPLVGPQPIHIRGKAPLRNIWVKAD